MNSLYRAKLVIEAFTTNDARSELGDVDKLFIDAFVYDDMTIFFNFLYSSSSTASTHGILWIRCKALRKGFMLYIFSTIQVRNAHNKCYRWSSKRLSRGSREGMGDITISFDIKRSCISSTRFLRSLNPNLRSISSLNQNYSRWLKTYVLKNWSSFSHPEITARLHVFEKSTL